MRVGCLTPRSGRFTRGNDSVAILQGYGWKPRLLWMCGKSRLPTAIRSPDRPARRESLHLLRYPGTHLKHNIWIN